VILVIGAAFILMLAHILNMVIPDCDQCYSELAPLIFVGIGYSIYGAALWGSIPYVVEARTVGTAFGFVTAIQNGGMAVAPTIGAVIHDSSLGSMHGYFWVSFFWACMCGVGCGLNIWLYFEDINHNGGTLNKVHKMVGEEDKVQDLMMSPSQDMRRVIEQSHEITTNEKEFLLNPSARGALKRSMARVKK